MSRKKVVAGNWKMNMLSSETEEFITALKDRIGETEERVIICTPYLDLQSAVWLCEDSSIKVGAQNMHFEEKGAFTGEVSPTMLKDINVEYVILGHSERRQYFAETDETVNKKLHSALKYGLKPIVCVGESLEQREKGITNDVLRNQIVKGLTDIKVEQVENIIIAYEPIWAIGTGMTATPEDADAACGYIRSVIGEIYNQAVAEKVIIQYGGSVNAKNAAELFAMPNIDGGLIGGASLKVEDFAIIVEAAR